jgi:RND family efflux transporter MFP subunit
MNPVGLPWPRASRGLRAGYWSRWVVLVLFFFAGPVPVLSQDEGAVGFLEPLARVELGFPEAGVIGAVNVREGQSVKQGEILAELDNRVLDASVAIARARSESTVEVRIAELTLRDRAERHQRLEGLRRAGNAREDEVLRAALDRQMAEQELDAAIERRRISELEYRRILAQRDQRRITSPVDGVVIKVDKDAGETVNAVDSPVMEVARLDILKLVVRLGQDRSRHLAQANEVRVRIADASQPVVGAIDHVAPVMDPRSGTVEVWVVVDNRAGAFKSGQRASIEFD